MGGARSSVNGKGTKPGVPRRRKNRKGFAVVEVGRGGPDHVHVARWETRELRWSLRGAVVSAQLRQFEVEVSRPR